MCSSMVDIQSATAEIRRGKKEERKKGRLKPQGKNMMSTSAMQGGHNNNNNNNKNNRSICKARNVSKHTESWREILTLTLILPLNLNITLNTSPKPIPYLECFYVMTKFTSVQQLRGYSIIGSGSRFTVNLCSYSLDLNSNF